MIRLINRNASSTVMWVHLDANVDPIKIQRLIQDDKL
jgi:hypothetical protein